MMGNVFGLALVPMMSRPWWGIIGFLLLCALAPPLCAQTVQITPQADGSYAITAAHYTARLAADGCLHSLQVQGREFLDASVPPAQGLALFDDHPLVLPNITMDGTTLIASNDAAQMRYEFDNGYLTLAVRHTQRHDTALVAVFDPTVAFVENLAHEGQLVSAPAEEAWTNTRLSLPTGEYLELHGGTRLWGRDWGRQVWEAVKLAPNQEHRFTLTLGVDEPKSPDPARFTTLTLVAADGKRSIPAGEPCPVQATLANAGGTAISGTITLRVQNTLGAVVQEAQSGFSCDPRGTTTLTWPVTLPAPDCYRLTGTAVIGATPLTAVTAVGYALPAVATVTTAPPDLDAFWETIRADAQMITPVMERTRDAERSGEITVYRVRIPVGNSACTGWLAIPQAPGSYPAIVMLASGEVRRLSPNTGLAKCGFVVLTLEPTGQPVDGDITPLIARALEQLADPQQSGLRGMVINSLVAIAALAAQPEVDNARIGVTGVGLSGGLAILLAAHAPQIQAVAADVPLGCDMMYGRDSTDWPYRGVKDYLAKSPQQADAMLRTMTYFDVAHAVSRLTCPALLSAGLQDQYAWPRGIAAVANRLTAPHDLCLYQSGHDGGGAEHWTAKVLWLRRHLGEPKLTKPEDIPPQAR